MNPQYMPQQAVPPQTFPPNRPPTNHKPPQIQNQISGPPVSQENPNGSPLANGTNQPPAQVKPLQPLIPGQYAFNQSVPVQNMPNPSVSPMANDTTSSSQPLKPTQATLPGQYSLNQSVPLQTSMPSAPPIINDSSQPPQPPKSSHPTMPGQYSFNQSMPPQSNSMSTPNAPSMGNDSIPPPQPSKPLQPVMPGQYMFNQSMPPTSSIPNPGGPPLSNGTNQPPQPAKLQQPSLPGQFPYSQPGMLNQPLAGGPPPNQFNQFQSAAPHNFNQQSHIPGQPPLSGPNQPHTLNPMFMSNAPHIPPSHPPMTGQPSPMFKQPPFPGQPNIATPPMPGGQFNQPPLPGQMNTNQLSNQMQNMSLSGPRQYPGIPQKLPGDNLMSPNSPPSYLNGQQVRNQQGFPPVPGQGQMPGYQQPYQQPQPQRRLDPDQMPNPIQVTQDDQSTRCGVFCTNQKGLVPPLVTTKYVVQDQGNSSPRLIRSTMYNVPISQDLMKQTAVPFGLVISPMARTVEGEYPPPIVNFGTLGPVRCIRCKAYMSPFMQFIDSGRRFQCLFCKASTDVPNEYFQHLDHTGQRMDKYERPELILGTYEMIATSDYCRNNTLPKPPAIIFVIDVSYNNVKSGLVSLLCSQMKEIIQNLPIDQGRESSNMRVGFITYNSTIHFYNIKGTLAAPQMLVVGDTQEMFMPLLDGFLCTPEESSAVIDQLMEQIPTMFNDTRETETVLLPAILAGLEALKASDCAGKLLVFHSTLPIAEAPGKLKNRDDRKLLGTEKERTVLTPQTQAYNQLGQDCVAAGCSVDLFIFNNAYIDVATIGQVARLSGGEVFKYTYFQADIDGERLIRDIITDISRPIAFDAVMRVRTSTGVRPTDFYGHFYMSNTTDMELASIDCDKAVAVEVKHDDKLNEEEGVYIQVALLYTSCSGERRLRILNLSLKTCSQMADLYRSCDLDTIINFFGKQAVYKLLDNNPKAVKDGIVNRAAQMLANYRKNCASPSSAGQLILPECMKLLPLYVNCLLKSDALSGGSDITIDDRSYVMQRVMTMDILTSVSYFYPRLIPIHDIKPESDGKVDVPAPIRCTIEKMHDQGVYILENGIHMFLWIGLGASQDFVQQVFGVPSAIQIDVDQISIPEMNNPMSIAVRSIIDEIRLEKHRCMRLTLVRQREKLEPVFKHFLVEDRGHDGSPSYVDFLCHMHKEIRTILS